MKSQDLRPGIAVSLDGQLWLVTQYDHVKPGKGPAYAQVKMKNLQTGTHIEKRFRSGEDVEQVDLDRRNIEYLYNDPATGEAVFMDHETFEQHTIAEAVLGDALLYLKPNTALTGLMHNEQIITIDLPKTVDLVVTDTAPGIKGATATNQPKDAILETGLKTRVPPFISNGETVRISTETGEYLSRV